MHSRVQILLRMQLIIQISQRMNSTAQILLIMHETIQMPPRNGCNESFTFHRGCNRMFSFFCGHGRNQPCDTSGRCQSQLRQCLSNSVLQLEDMIVSDAARHIARLSLISTPPGSATRSKPFSQISNGSTGCTQNVHNAHFHTFSCYSSPVLLDMHCVSFTTTQ